MATSQDFVNWVCTDALDWRFLKSVLVAERDALLRYAHGTTHQTIYFPEVKAFWLATPPRSEQHAITSVLGALDDKIESNRRLSAHYEATATESLHHIARFGYAPATWGSVPFSSAVHINPRVRVPRGTRTPFIEMSAVEPYSTRPTRLTERAFSGGSKFEHGDTLMARITGCIEHGKGAFIDFLDGPGAGSTEFLVFRAIHPLTPEAVFFLTRDSRFRAHAIANMTGTSGRQRVDRSCFDSIRLFLAPESPERESACTMLKTAMLTTRALWRETRTLQSIRDALLPKLVSGQIRVPLSNDPEEQVGAAIEALA